MVHGHVRVGHGAAGEITRHESYLSLNNGRKKKESFPIPNSIQRLAEVMKRPDRSVLPLEERLVTMAMSRDHFLRRMRSV